MWDPQCEDKRCGRSEGTTETTECGRGLAWGSRKASAGAAREQSPAGDREHSRQPQQRKRKGPEAGMSRRVQGKARRRVGPEMTGKGVGEAHLGLVGPVGTLASRSEPGGL